MTSKTDVARQTFDRKHDELISASRIMSNSDNVSTAVTSIDDYRQPNHKRSLMPDIDALMIASYNQNADNIMALRYHIEVISRKYATDDDVIGTIQSAGALAMSHDMQGAYEVLERSGFKKSWSRLNMSQFVQATKVSLELYRADDSAPNEETTGTADA